MNVAPVTREFARAVGLKSYFTGEPCRRGHIAPRNVAEGDCLACRRLKSQVRRGTVRSMPLVVTRPIVPLSAIDYRSGDPKGCARLLFDLCREHPTNPAAASAQLVLQVLVKKEAYNGYDAS